MSLHNSSLPSTPKITSTPLLNKRKDIFNRSVLMPRRYSLSEADYEKNFDHIGVHPEKLHKSPIPLSSQLDIMKRGSPRSQIAYQNENKERPAIITHQPKYNSPGVFPIVHLFKRDLPILKEKPKNEASRIASPELSKHNTPEQNRLLLEKIIQTSTNRINSNNQNIEISTRSVLDALKEISRKRIHASEDCDFLTEGKRIRIDHANETETKKRQRNDASYHENSSTSIKHPMKKHCSFNELLASTTSMELRSPKSETAISKKTQSSSKVHLNIEVEKVKPLIQLIDVETQTPPPPPPQNNSTSNPLNKEIEEANKQLEIASPIVPPKKLSPVKIFDETPLERLRKNRLSILMGTVSDNKIESTNKNDVVQKENILDNGEKTIVSILSTSDNKNTEKSNKHVTFNLPPESTILTSPTTTASSIDLANQSRIGTPLTQTTTSITSPLSSTTANENVSSNNNFFNNISSIKNNTNPVATNDKPVEIVVTSPSVPQMPKVLPQASTENKLNSQPKIGGFKFDLSTTNTSSVAITASITTTTTSQFNKPRSPSGGFSSGIATKPNNSTFSLPTTTSNTFSPFTKTPASQPFISSTSTPQTSSTTVFTNQVTTPNENKFSFSTLPTYTNSTSINTSAPKFNFSSPNSFSITSTANATGFNTTTTTAAVSSTHNFPSTTSIFGNSENKSIFGNATLSSNNVTTIASPFSNPTSTFNAFKSPTSSSTSGFMTNTAITPTAPKFGAATDTPKFGSTEPLKFGNTTEPPKFGSTLETTKFGGTNTSGVPKFGTTSEPPKFGSVSSETFKFGATSEPPKFGVASEPPKFGAASEPPKFGTGLEVIKFGNASQPPKFGSITTTTEPIKFGATSEPPRFGAAATEPPKFGATTAPPKFGTTIEPPKFGLTAEGPKFGTIAEPPKFGLIGGEPPKFGTTASDSLKFGAVSEPPKFGAATEPVKFGSATTELPKFGNTLDVPKFGAMTEVPKFGSTSTDVPKFGTVAEPPKFGGFGTENTVAPNMFANSTSNFNPSGFGTGNFTFKPTTINFGKPETNTTSPPLNLTQNTPIRFGNAGDNNNSGFNFNANNTNNTKPPVFSFGSGQPEPPKPTFNFTASTPATNFTNPPSNFNFGSSGNNAPSFGANTTPAFQFNTPIQTAPAPGMFNIGSGTSTPRSRTQLKAKRRT